MELTERIAARVAELASEAELLRKQLADAEHELERLGDSRPGHHPADGRWHRRRAGCGRAGAAGFGLLVPPRSQAFGPADLPDDYRSLLDAVAAAEAGGPAGPAST